MALVISLAQQICRETKVWTKSLVSWRKDNIAWDLHEYRSDAYRKKLIQSVKSVPGQVQGICEWIKIWTKTSNFCRGFTMTVKKLDEKDNFNTKYLLAHSIFGKAKRDRTDPDFWNKKRTLQSFAAQELPTYWSESMSSDPCPIE